MKVINFTKQVFPSLAFMEFSSRWNPVTLDDLSESECRMFSRFLKLVSCGAEVDETILLAKAMDGCLEQVYGPTMFRDRDKLVIKTGQNVFPVEYRNGRIYAGELEGQIVFDSNPTGLQLQDGKRLDVYMPRAEFTHDDYLFSCPYSIDWSQSKGLKKLTLEQKIQDCLMDEKPIVQFFNQRPAY